MIAHIFPFYAETAGDCRLFPWSEPNRNSVIVIDLFDSLQLQFFQLEDSVLGRAFLFAIDDHARNRRQNHNAAGNAKTNP